jgi:hypothetical protein
MSTAQEFHYRLASRVRGTRPGSHPASSIGAGQEFVSHMRLYDRPDPRRLDLRASLREVRGEWLIRVTRQRASISVYAVVDVSRSMQFGSERPKLASVAEFLESLGLSAFRAGDALGMLAFDTRERTDLFVPARTSRGMGTLMAAKLRGHAYAGAGDVPRAGGSRGLEQAVSLLAGREGLVFVVSDFHWPLERLSVVLDALAHAFVVPIVVWDRAEVEPPSRNGIAFLEDSESGAQRTLWMRPGLRARWREAVAAHRERLDRLFEVRGVRPYYLLGSFDAQSLSRYFVENAA